MKFRNCTIDDNIQNTCNYNYSQNYVNKNNLDCFLNNIFPDNNIRNNILLYIALAMCGMNNINLLMIFQWSSIRYKDLFIDVITDCFGKYCRITNDMPIYNYSNTCRIGIIKSINVINEQCIYDLVHKRQTIKCISLCMTNAKPVIEPVIKNSIGHITISNNNYTHIPIIANDLFLLLLEYLIQYKQNNIIDMKSITYKTSSIEQICFNFMNDCITLNTDEHIKCKDIYDKYIEWNNTHPHKIIGKIILFAELKKYMHYNRAVKINGVSCAVFMNISLK